MRVKRKVVNENNLVWGAPILTSISFRLRLK
jgi:hypothetical protein